MSVEAPKLSIVLLTLNEEHNIGVLISGLLRVVTQLDLTSEVIVVDGGSTDNTWQVAERAGAICILQRRLGYAGALREGLSAARGEHVLTLDSDLSHPPELLADMWKCRDDAEIVVASRFVPGGSSAAPAFRHLMSRVLNVGFSRSLALPVTDLSSGYRLYRRDVLTPGLYEAENFSIQQEILVRAYCDGYSIKEVPLQYRERASGASHVSLLSFGLSYIPTWISLWKLRNLTSAADYEYRSYFSIHPLQRYWIRHRTELIARYVGEAQRVLDIGSGSNYLAATRQGFLAVDSNPSKIRFLKRKNAQAVVAGIESLPFENESFEVVILSEILPYVEDIKGALSEVSRVLRTGGSVVVTVPDSHRMAWRIIKFLYNSLPNVRASGLKSLNEFFRRGIIDLFAESGFRVTGCRYLCGAELVMGFVKVA